MPPRAFIFLLPFVAGAAAAQTAPEGTWELVTDGARGVLEVRDGGAEVAVVARGCQGHLEGRVGTVADDHFDFTGGFDDTSCTLRIDLEDGKPVRVTRAGGACWAFSGASCSLEGVVGAPTLSFSGTAVKTAFEGVAREDRRAIQRALAEAGYYRSGIDGLMGPGTERAIRELAQARFDAGEGPNLATVPGAERFLLGLIARPAVEAEADARFLGTWDCGNAGEFVFAREGYGTGPELDRYAAFDTFDDAVMIEFVGGDRLSLLDLTETEMTWHSPASGDTFECRRAGGASDGGADGQGVDAVVPGAGTDAQRGRAFEGRWTCRQEEYDLTSTVTLGSDSVTVEELGTTVRYDTVTPLGRNGTAWQLRLTDGQEIGLFEMDGANMLAASGLGIMECAR